jgi:beta-ureidopropionase
MSRRVRVATMSLLGVRQGSVEKNREMVMTILGQCCQEKPDIVCMPEEFAICGIPLKEASKAGMLKLAETVPGVTTDMVAGYAKKHRTNVVCPILRRDGDRMYNSAVFLDRKGQVAGIYDKMHLVSSVQGGIAKLDGGKIPGAKAPVFELDFGRVGAQICFDMGFQEGWQELEDGGAELVFWPSAYDGGFHLQMQAYLHHYYVVSSVTTSHASIVNPLGEVLEKTGWMPWTAHTIDLDFRVCHFDWNLKTVKEIKKKYGDAVNVHVLNEEGVFLVESNRDDLPLAKVLKEFPLETTRDYHRRHLEAYGEARAGRLDPSGG